MSLFFDIPGFKNYQISIHGEVKRVGCYVDGKLSSKRWIPECYLNPCINKHGYLTVPFQVDKKRFTRYLHHIMGIVFLKNPYSKRTVNHNDGNKLNNELYNLEWATDSEQALHAYKMGLKTALRGEKNGMYGRKRPDNTQKQTGGKNYFARFVLDQSTGIFYDCLKDAAQAKGIKNVGTLYSRVRESGPLKNTTSLIYV